LKLPRGSSARFTATARGGVTCLCVFARTNAPLSSSRLLLLVAPVKPTVFPLPLVGFAFRFEFLRVPRRPANDHKRPLATAELDHLLRHEFQQELRHELSPHMLRDVGLDRSRAD
jgi:hypothetical protein